MSDNCAATSLFGWDFQINAAIAILIDNISQVEKVRVEGKKQDIEITLTNKEKIYAQAKAVETPGNYNNVKKHLANALNSLNNTAAKSKNNVKQFIYITNSENPLGNIQTISQFIGPYVRHSYNELTPKSKTIVDNALSKAEQAIAIDKDKLYIYILNFNNNGLSQKDRYTNIKRLVDEFVEGLLENRNGIGGTILDVWQKELLLNGSTANTNITLDRKSFMWIIVVKAIENSLYDNSFYKEIDISQIQTVENHFREFINTSIVRFEFITSVLSEFNNFKPKQKNKKTEEFISTNWENFKEEFSLEDLENDTQEILIKRILARIIYQSVTINNMKEKNLI